MRSIATVVKTLLAVMILVALGMFAFVWSGRYPVAAGSGHSAPVTWLLETTRERAVAVRAADLIVPDDLDSPDRIAAGAAHYDSMCAGCHAKPGQEPTDSFDPAPPALYRQRLEPRAAFWTIKHGLKMTAMPSHLDHSDKENWDTVAFVQALPDMNSEEYLDLTEDAVHEHDDQEDGHDNGDDGHSHDQAEPTSELTSETESDTGPDREPTAETPQQAIDGFTRALIEGRGEAALAWLHPKATIIEGGHVQSVDEYAAGHLDSDMTFLSQIEIEPISRDIQVTDGQATVETRSRFSGQVDDRSIDLESTEFATLIQTEDGWRVSQIAWSSQPFSAGESTEAETEENQNPQSHSEGDDDHDH